jgi:short subunit dehydrogenase-like uncharacterized protein
MPTILLYGANGYSGRLIMEELVRSGGATHVILAGRNGDALATLARANGLQFRVFGVDDPPALAAGLHGVDVVINAAGPFAPPSREGFDRVARAAIEAGAHYTDINGDVRVYQRLRRHDDAAKAKGSSIVASAGYWSAASNILIEKALVRLRAAGVQGPLRAIRIAMSGIATPSRGSAATVWSVLNDHTVLGRRREVDGGGFHTLPSATPVGRLERKFTFAGTNGSPREGIATIASLVDTLTAMEAARAHAYDVFAIESYVEAGGMARAANALGGYLGPLIATPAAQSLARAPLGLFAEGPTKAERVAARHDIVLEIEDRFYTPVLSWRWNTPNLYDFNATLVTKIALGMATSPGRGWMRPNAFISKKDKANLQWPDCTFDPRISPRVQATTSRGAATVSHGRSRPSRSIIQRGPAG